MPIDHETDIEPGQLYKETDTEKAFKILDVRPELEQVKVLYLTDIDREQMVDTRGRSEIMLVDAIRRRLAEGSLVRITAEPGSGPWR